MSLIKNTLQSILRHFLKVVKVFIPFDTKRVNVGDPTQDYDEFGERRH